MVQGLWGSGLPSSRSGILWLFWACAIVLPTVLIEEHSVCVMFLTLGTIMVYSLGERSKTLSLYP